MFLDPYRFGGGGTDPNFSSVSLLMHCDGSNGSTTLVDSSSYGKSMTCVANAQLSTSSPKFGTAALLLDGTGDYVSTPYHASLDLTADFTMEAWINPVSVADQKRITEKFDGVNGGWSWGRNNTGHFFQATTAGGLGTIISSGSGLIGAGSWQHVAVSRSGNNWYIFTNGILNSTATSSAPTQMAANAIFTVGGGPVFGTGVSWNGGLDDIRVTKGVCRYTANFTPPTGAFPDA